MTNCCVFPKRLYKLNNVASIQNKPIFLIKVHRKQPESKTPTLNVNKNY